MMENPLEMEPDASEVADALVREYLLSRGLVDTFDTFVVEAQQDALDGYRPSEMARRLVGLASAGELVKLSEQWQAVSARLEHNCRGPTHEAAIGLLPDIRIGLYRLCLVAVAERGGPEEVFEAWAGHPELFTPLEAWNRWLELQFIQRPQEHPRFSCFFSSEWKRKLGETVQEGLSAVTAALGWPLLMDHRPLLDASEQVLTRIDGVHDQMQQLSQQLLEHNELVQEAQSELRHKLLPPDVPDNEQHPGSPQSAVGPTSDEWSVTRPPFIVVKNDLFTLDPLQGPRPALDHACCRISPDGKQVATAAVTGLLHLWGPGSIRPRSVGCAGSVKAMAWAGRPNQMLLYGQDGRVVLLDTSTDTVAQEFLGPEAFPVVGAVATCPGSASFVSATHLEGGLDEGYLAAYNMRTGQEEIQFEVSPTPTRIRHMAFNQNGKLMVTAGADGMIRLFDVGSRQAIMGWPAHNPAGVCSVLFTEDENAIVSCGEDGCLHLWSLHHMAKSLCTIGIPSMAGFGGRTAVHVSMAASLEREYIMAVSSQSCDGYIYKTSQLWQGAVQCIFRHNVPLLALDWQPSLNVCTAMGVDGTLCASKITRRLETPYD